MIKWLKGLKSHAIFDKSVKSNGWENMTTEMEFDWEQKLECLSLIFCYPLEVHKNPLLSGEKEWVNTSTLSATMNEE